MMQQKSTVAVLVALVVVLAGMTIYFAVSNNAYAPSASQPVPAQSLAGKIPATTSQTVTPNQTATNNQAINADETANWKTYTNSKYKFSLKYPSNGTYKETSYGIGEPQPRGTVFDVVFDFNGDLFDIYIGDDANLSPPNGMDPEFTKDITIGGKKGKNYDDYAYVIANEKNSFVFNWGPKFSETPIYFKKMLDSFKFTQ